MRQIWLLRAIPGRPGLLGYQSLSFCLLETDASACAGLKDFSSVKFAPPNVAALGAAAAVLPAALIAGGVNARGLLVDGGAPGVRGSNVRHHVHPLHFFHLVCIPMMTVFQHKTLHAKGIGAGRVNARSMSHAMLVPILRKTSVCL